MTEPVGVTELGVEVLAGEIAPPSDNLVVTVDSPIGSTSSSAPLVQWHINSDGDTSIQETWIVYIDDGPNEVTSSGWVIGTETQWQVNENLNAGQVYQVRVTVISDTPSTDSGSASFQIRTPDLQDEVSLPYLRNTAELVAQR